jgi:hypothetical protein
MNVYIAVGEMAKDTMAEDFRALSADIDGIIQIRVGRRGARKGCG